MPESSSTRIAAVIQTRRGIRKLAQQASEAMSRIEGLFSRTALSIDGMVAWGQFLDAPRQESQFGIYGTAAAIQVLAAAGVPPQNRLIAHALEGLPFVEPRGDSEKRYDSADVFLTHKAAFLLSAAQPGSPEFTTREPIEDRILERLIDSRGSGDFAFPEGQDDVPNVLATTTTLLALARDREFRSMPQCESVLRWLCRNIINDGGLKAHEVALALLALVAYRSVGVRVQEYPTAQEVCTRRLVDWARHRERALLGQNVENHYWVPLPGVGRNHYMFYLPDILVALALLLASNPQPTRQFVLRVVKQTADNTLEHDGYRSPSNTRLCSVDQLWVYLLLAEFSTVAKDDATRLLPELYVALTSTPLQRICATVILLALGTAATVLGLGTHAIGTRAAGLVMASLFLAVLGTALYSWLSDR